MNPKDVAVNVDLIISCVILIIVGIASTNLNITLLVLLGLVVQFAILFSVLWYRRMAHYDLPSDLQVSSWDTYPRPQMRRASYLNLNDGWTMNGSHIRLPFVPQSVLSEYKGRIKIKNVYERELKIPSGFCKKDDDRIILHFGAVDQIADVLIDGINICHHEGGYLPFEVDISHYVMPNVEDGHKLTVIAKDATSRQYPYGKQRIKRGGMWYTPISGIWQTVWLESVPFNYIKKLKITPTEDKHIVIDAVANDVVVNNATNHNDSKVSYVLKIKMNDKDIEVSSVNPHFDVDLNEYSPILWTPNNPKLYDFTFSIVKDDELIDAVDSYFALRTISIKEVGGYKRLFLNGQPIFFNGVLDQGYFSNGIFFPANEAGYANDIMNMKSLGFNMLRKHIKIEPEEFYYQCDKLGMLVMQDMVNSGRYEFVRETALPTLGFQKRDDKLRIYTNKRKRIFEEHSKETVELLYNHPCIVAYTVFNEGWGQYDSNRITAELKAIDNTRLYDNTSGWFDQGENDFDSRHLYFDQTPICAKEGKVLFLSECGGFSQAIPDHYYAKYSKYGYGDCQDKESLTDRTIEMYENMVLPSIKTGLSGVIYTQVSDVEDEVNGFYTYDRKICKFNEQRIAKLNADIYQEYDRCISE